ncbi:hypothetical protein, partial [Kitasatospora sp. NPDC007106]
MPSHRWIVSELPPLSPRPAAAEIVAGCHRRLRGPYTGVDTVLRAVLPEAVRRWPELVDFHRVELLYGMPELADLI